MNALRYYLWTRQNQNVNQELIFGNLTSIEESNFDASKKTKVLVHGYTDNGKTGWVLRMKDTYLEKGKLQTYVQSSSYFNT